jgi:hypothetical protein
MNFHERIAEIYARMRADKLDLLIALHDGAHFIEKRSRCCRGGGRYNHYYSSP